MRKKTNFFDSKGITFITIGLWKVLARVQLLALWRIIWVRYRNGYNVLHFFAGSFNRNFMQINILTFINGEQKNNGIQWDKCHSPFAFMWQLIQNATLNIFETKRWKIMRKRAQKSIALNYKWNIWLETLDQECNTFNKWY